MAKFKATTARVKMSKENRAKQFMPFAALKGFEDALRRVERVVVPKMELSEDYKEELDWKLQQLQLRDMATVVYYHEGEYLKVTGLVSRLDINARVLKIVNTKIKIDDIYELEIVNQEKNDLY